MYYNSRRKYMEEKLLRYKIEAIEEYINQEQPIVDRLREVLKVDRVHIDWKNLYFGLLIAVDAYFLKKT